MQGLFCQNAGVCVCVCVCVPVCLCASLSVFANIQGVDIIFRAKPLDPPWTDRKYAPPSLGFPSLLP